MKYIITQEQVDKLKHGFQSEITDVLRQLKPIEPLTEERVKEVCSMIYASDYPQGVADIVPGCSAYDAAIAKAIESAITGEHS